MISKKGIRYVDKIDLLSMFFLAVIYFFSFVVKTDSIFIYAIYFVFAIPYYKHLEKLALICFMLSTIAFFFRGADESLWSLYTIFCVISLFSIFKKSRSRISLISILPMVVMIVPVILSYKHSVFHYSKGLFLLLFEICIGIVFAVIIDFDSDDNILTSFFPTIACFQMLAYFVAAMLSPTLTSYGATLVVGMNHNAFGISCAQIGTIIGVKAILIEGGKNKFYLLMLLISYLTTFVTGSRNAFLGLTVALVITYLFLQKVKGKSLSGFLKFCLIAGLVIVVMLNILPLFGFDISRYNYVDVVSSGGSNRTYLWSLLIPLIISRYNIFGYGPSHYCSQQIVTPLVGRNYVHTHNLLFEAWGELGLVGLIPFLILLVMVFKTAYKKKNFDMKYYVLFALLIEMLVNGIGESMFADIMMWLLFGLILSTKRRKLKI